MRDDAHVLLDADLVVGGDADAARLLAPVLQGEDAKLAEGGDVVPVTLAQRVGPARAVQSGQITQPQMLKAMAILAILSLFFGLFLLFSAFQSFGSSEFYSFLGVGLLAILAAVTYTAGKKPYGYAGFGDLSVMIFFE